MRYRILADAVASFASNAPLHCENAPDANIQLLQPGSGTAAFRRYPVFQLGLLHTESWYSGGFMLTEHPLLNAVIFASLGIAVFAAAAAILLRVTPLKLWRELVEERNVAVAIFAGAAAIGICLIIAAAMH
jgi:hypothetical protein